MLPSSCTFRVAPMVAALLTWFVSGQGRAETPEWRAQVERQVADWPSAQAAREAAQDARDAARDAAQRARDEALAATEHLDELIADALESATASIGQDSVKEIVKNAPFSADVVYETRQILSDGNRIVRRSQSSFARDSMGRTRQQRGVRSVVIDDVVAGRTYLLHPGSKTAVRLPRLAGNPMRIAGTADVEVRPGRVVVQRKAGTTGEDVRVEVIRVEPGTALALAAPPAPPTAPTPPLPPLSLHGQPLSIPLPHGRGLTESIGTREIEGVRADGTRTTYTVPAGAIGNERPIVTTAERWFSPELQVVVLATTSDPRSGEAIYRLTNIKRSEPAAELFRIPSDVRMRGEDRQR